LGKYFGTDGVRGLANGDLTPELTMEIGRAGAYVLAGNLGKAPKILIGNDTRISADMLEAALVAGLCSVGAEIYKAGVAPSPAMAYLVRHYHMDAAVMLSASHNPMPDNGIKFFSSTGYKLPDEVEEEIEALLDKQDQIPRPTGEAIGRRLIVKDAVEDYVSFLMETIGSLEGMRVALDCANGACCEAAPLVFKRLGAEVLPIHYKPNGVNINVDCGSTHMESLAAFVKANKVDIGLAFDGDGDRVLAVDENGELIDGDQIMAICALSLKQKGRLKNNTLVATVMSNLGLQNFCDKEGIRLKRTKVGDRYVIQEMKAGGYTLGGEQSGHIIFLDHNTTGDGILTGLQLVAMLKERGQKMSELSSIMTPLPQVLLGAKLKNKLKADVRENKKIDEAIRDLEKRLEGNGRLLVRPSGTEPLVRVMIEGQNQDEIKKWAEELVSIIGQEL